MKTKQNQRIKINISKPTSSLSISISSTIILLFAYLSITTPLQAQCKKGFIYLDEENWQKSERSFRQGQLEVADRAACNIGLGYLYQKKAASNYQLDSAYTYLKDYSTWFAQLNKKQRKYFAKQHIEEASTAQLLSQVIEDALAVAIAANSPASCEHFTKHYTTAPEALKTKAYQQWHQLAYQSVQIGQQLTDYAEFLQAHKTTLQQYSPTLYATVTKTILEVFLQQHTWEQFAEFEKQFPDNPFVKDRGKASFLKIREASTKQVFQDFLSQYPNSLFVVFAQEKIQNLDFLAIEKSDRQQDILDFFIKYPNSTHAVALDARLSTLLAEQTTLNQIERSINKIAISDIPQTLLTIYQLYTATGIPNRLEDCIKAYPFFKDSSFYAKDVALMDLYKALPKPYTPENQITYESYIRQAAPKYSAFTSLQKMLTAQIDIGQWQEAFDIAKKWLPVFGEEYVPLQNLLSLLAAPVNQRIKKQGLAGLVNTEHNEYSPVISVNGQLIYFCRRQGDKELVFTAAKEQHTWGSGEAIQGRGNRAPISVSVDGTQLLLFENGRINYSTKTKKGWSRSQPIGAAINESAWQGGASLSSDGNVLIFAARRLENIGVSDKENIDLFVSIKDKKGGWGQPTNLGKNINSSLKERTPFLHPDLRTLYFSSNGLGGLGGLDVFMTTRLDENWTEWSDPVNLGKMINTSADDWGYSVSTDGQLGYFATNSITDNQQDIYQVDIPSAFRPSTVSTISGKLLTTTGTPISATITIEDLAKQTIVAQLHSDPLTGEYFAVLPEKKLYGYAVEKSGFFPDSGNLDLRSTSNNQQSKTDFRLYTLAEAKASKRALPISNLFFEVGKADLHSTSYTALNRLAKLIKRNGLQVTIEGHTDNVGNDEKNKILSEKRAGAVKNYLIQQGVAGTAITAKGFGAATPIASNELEEGRAKNRRVEIRLGQ